MKWGDILLNPRPDASPWKYKSDNKTVIAWACGLPVARDAAELGQLLDPVFRAEEILRRWGEVREHFDVRQSVREWLEAYRATVAERARALEACAVAGDALDVAVMGG
jgi:hypothetical protein